MIDPLVASLPAPTPGAMTFYVFGPRPGEAIVIALPDGSWVLVDACLQDGKNVAKLILERFGVTRLALAVLTHPDADHYRGFADCLVRFDCDYVWSYPYALQRRQLLAALARRDPADRRGRELSTALSVIEASLAANRGRVVSALQSRPLGEVMLHCVAPCSGDMVEESRRLAGILERVLAGVPITDGDGRLLRGEKLDGTGNGLSLALIAEWRGRRFLLGGDVEDPIAAHRGWSGVIESLDGEGRLDLLRDISLIKAAHHGSAGAHSNNAYLLHGATTRPIVIVTPFAPGLRSPPHPETLAKLRHRCGRLAVTSEPLIGWPSVRAQGWAEEPRADDAGACCAVAIAHPDGAIDLSAHGRARTFR